MNETEIDFYITRILSGYLIFFYNGERYELQYPSNNLKYEAYLIYNNIINDEKYAEWIREENLIRILIMLGLWSKDTEKSISKMEKQIENYKVDIYNNFFNKDLREKIRNNLRSMENSLNRVLGIKSDFLSNNTLEGYAASIKNEYIISNTLYKNKKLVFNNDNNKNNSSYQYFNALVNEINQHMIPIKIYKLIARNNSWRSIWNCNKNQVIDRPAADWTEEQKSLINLTKMYDSIYEHPESPDEKIIDDDDALDGWLISQRKKNATAKTQNDLDNTNPHLKKAQEVFVIANQKEDIEEVFGLNSSEGIGRMKEKFNFIKNNLDTSEINDLSLPDVQRDARSQLAEKLKQRKS